MLKRNAHFCLLATLLGACSTLVGADFEDRNLASPSAGASNGGSGNGGGAGSAGVSAASGSSGSSGNAGATSGAGGGTAGSPTAGSGGSSGGGQPEGGAGSGGSPEAGAGGSAGGGEGGGTGENPIVRINEVRAQGPGDDFIELYNLGPGSINLQGYGIADSNHLFIIPRAFVIEQGGFLLFLMNQPTNMEAPTCNVPNQPCFHVDWGVAQTGEVVSLYSPGNILIDTTTYPAPGPSGVANDESWGRLPDGTGAFAPIAVTPEMPNQP